MKAVLSPNPYRDRGLKTSKAAQKILEEQGIKTVICLPFELDENSRLDIPTNIKLASLSEELDSADFLICFGGDGTILSVARHLKEVSVPILGVNLGTKGFMANIEPEDLEVFLSSDVWDCLNVTIPYKQAVIPFCTALTERAKAAGAVNVLLKKDGKLYGWLREIETDFQEISTFRVTLPIFKE